jgi:hypothetical protein
MGHNLQAFNAIVKKIVSKVAQRITRNILAYSNTPLAHSASSSEVVLTTGVLGPKNNISSDHFIFHRR